jgi:SAM-dependent methyltransferase
MTRERKNPEQALYAELYRRQAEGGYTDSYGHTNHGGRFADHLKRVGAVSVLDVGCGHNEFVRALRERGIRAWGVDFACPGADQLVDVLELPFADKSWEWVTAWDMLEHLRPEQVDRALEELARVSDKFAFTIAHRPSYHTVDGRPLHPTVEPPEWWLTQLRRFGVADLIDNTFMGHWTHG